MDINARSLISLADEEAVPFEFACDVFHAMIEHYGAEQVLEPSHHGSLVLGTYIQARMVDIMTEQFRRYHDGSEISL